MVANAWPQIVSWQSIGKGVLLGTLCDTLCDTGENEFWRVLHMESGATLSQHCHNDASEILHILVADENEAKIGPCEQWTDRVQSDSLKYYLPSAPKIIKVNYKWLKIKLITLSLDGAEVFTQII